MDSDEKQDKKLGKKKKREAFGNALAREREKRGLSLKELSDRIGKDENGKPRVSPSYLNRLETGDRDNPTIELVCLLASELDIDIREILKEYGYEKFLSDDFEKIEDIGSIIRLNNIKVTNNEGELEKYLSKSEKEILIEIITYIFQYSITNDKELPIYMGKIINSTIKFREEVKGYSVTRINLDNNKEIKIVYDRNIKRNLDKFEIDDKRLGEMLEETIKEINISEEKDFFVYNKNAGLIIYCEVYDDVLRVLSINSAIKIV